MKTQGCAISYPSKRVKGEHIVELPLRSKRDAAAIADAWNKLNRPSKPKKPYNLADEI